MTVQAPPPKPPPKPGAPRERATSMSDTDKAQITLQALGLLNEQIEARIVHYRGDLETNAELDAVTAEVVAQLKAMQQALSPGDAVQRSPEELDRIEQEQIAVLTRLLERAFSKTDQTNLVTKHLKPIGKRIAKLFFESELHEKSKGDKEKKIHLPEQGVFYVLQRYKNRLRGEIDGFDYAGDDVRKATADLLSKVERDLQVAFLSKRSPELNGVMTIFTAVLVDFLQVHMPPRVPQMAKVTVRAAESARQRDSVGYKIRADRFPQFRANWERLFLEQMVNYCGDELLARLADSSESFLDETVKFFTDPHVYSETCAVLCDALYDFLCMEGLLDLPIDWRVTMTRAEDGA